MLFIYCDANDVITKRELGNYKDDGIYLQGYCIYSKGVKLFRKDRIIKQFDRNEDLTEFNAAPHPEDTIVQILTKEQRKALIQEGHALEICFSGVFSVKKSILQEKARENDMLVRTSVTKNLMFLCVGHRGAGPVKIKKAEDQGVYPLTEDEFHKLVDTGEMPESWIKETSR